jgi:hypothetical protein
VIKADESFEEGWRTDAFLAGFSIIPPSSSRFVRSG